MTHKSGSGTGRFCPESGVIIIPTQPTQPSGEIMSEDELEPVEADPVPAAASAEPDDESVVTTEATALSDREGQRLVSTQTVQHDYLTLNGQVARETITVDGTVTTVMDFIYDESGRPFALKYSDDGGKSFKTYYYILNLQGDVVKLVWYIPGFEYKTVATYTYDAWGNVLTATGDMAEINPLRYRGYYFDSETGFYYLQSRYYDPVNHRFINADGYASTGQGLLGCNMFAYCNNNPIMRIDPNGNSCIALIIATAVIASCTLFLTACDSGPGYIDDQRTCAYAELPMGDSTVGESGCGIVAAYNILISRGVDVTFLDVYEKSIECIGARKEEVLGAGMTMEEIMSVIENFDSSIYSSSDIYQSALIRYDYGTKNGVYGAHVVAAIYEPNNKVRIYNDGFVSTSAIGLYDYCKIVRNKLVEIDGKLCTTYITQIIVFPK